MLPFWQIYGESTAASSTSDKKFTAKTNVFVKPNEQNRACSSYAMARKRRMKSNSKQRKKPPKTTTFHRPKQEKHKIIAFFDTFSLQFQSYIVTLHLMGRG